MAKRISLASQIAEVERELAMRAKVYPGRVSSRAMRQAEADLYIEHLTGALDSLRWLQANSAAIAATRENNRALWDALRMIREVVEAHMPAGALPASEKLGPEPKDEAEALVRAIVAIATAKAPTAPDAAGGIP